MNNFWKNKKILVTGAAGFIGSKAIADLLRKKSVVTAVISKKKSKNNLNLIKMYPGLKIEIADLLSFEDCIRITKDQEILLNFAAIDGNLKYKLDNSNKIFRNNSQIVLNILEAAKINKIDRILIMSSIGVYPSNSELPIKEEYGLNQGLDIKDGYAWSKRFSEIAAINYFDKVGLKIAIARPGNVYGPGEIMSKQKSRIIPIFIHRALKNEDIIIYGNGLQKISFLHVSDLNNALFDLVEHYTVCDPINLVGSEYTTLLDLAKLIIKLSKSRSKIVLQRKQNYKNEDKIISTEKSKNIIAFEEKINLKKGLHSLISSYRSF